MMQKPCAYCGDMTDMPFECNYCKDPFCPEHRLPEDHRCVKLTQIRSKKFGEKKIIRTAVHFCRLDKVISNVCYNGNWCK